MADLAEAKEKKRILENKEGFARIIDSVTGYRDNNPPLHHDSLDELDANAREG